MSDSYAVASSLQLPIELGPTEQLVAPVLETSMVNSSAPFIDAINLLI
jgi:hypothetical protein